MTITHELGPLSGGLSSFFGRCWFIWPLDGDMEQINCYAFVNLGMNLNACFLMAKLPVKGWIANAQKSQALLREMLVANGKFKFDESEMAARNLLGVVDDIVKAHEADGEAVMDAASVARYNTAVWAFDNATQVEFARAPIFYVTPKGVYETRRLINNADAVYEGYAHRLPQEAIADTKAAGRCLAFSLYTAAGFHIARASEAVIKQYMTAWGCDPPKDSQRNWGAYTRALADKGANKIIVHHIDQLRELHRNPITHPEVTLTMGDAIALQAMCHSAIQAMVADMESKRQAPDSGIAAMLPAASLSARSSGIATVAATMSVRQGFSELDDAPTKLSD